MEAFSALSAAYAALLQSKQLVIQRYVRVAAPARGTLLATGNFDIFLSALLTLIGRVPGFREVASWNCLLMVERLAGERGRAG